MLDINFRLTIKQRVYNFQLRRRKSKTKKSKKKLTIRLPTSQ